MLRAMRTIDIGVADFHMSRWVRLDKDADATSMRVVDYARALSYFDSAYVATHALYFPFLMMLCLFNATICRFYAAAPWLLCVAHATSFICFAFWRYYVMPRDISFFAPDVLCCRATLSLLARTYAAATFRLCLMPLDIHYYFSILLYAAWFLLLRYATIYHCLFDTLSCRVTAILSDFFRYDYVARRLYAAVATLWSHITMLYAATILTWYMLCHADRFSSYVVWACHTSPLMASLRCLTRSRGVCCRLLTAMIARLIFMLPPECCPTTTYRCRCHAWRFFVFRFTLFVAWCSARCFFITTLMSPTVFIISPFLRLFRFAMPFDVYYKSRRYACSYAGFFATPCRPYFRRAIWCRAYEPHVYVLPSADMSADMILCPMPLLVIFRACLMAPRCAALTRILAAYARCFMPGVHTRVTFSASRWVLLLPHAAYLPPAAQRLLSPQRCAHIDKRRRAESRAAVARSIFPPSERRQRCAAPASAEVMLCWVQRVWRQYYARGVRTHDMLLRRMVRLCVLMLLLMPAPDVLRAPRRFDARYLMFVLDIFAY